MVTPSADDLKATKKYGKEWYDGYAGKPVARNGNTLVITPTTYPHILRQEPSMYSRRAVFDAATHEAKEFYEARGIKVVIAGPEGLGGGDDIFGVIVSTIISVGTLSMGWLTAHWSTLAVRLLPYAIRLKGALARRAEQKYLKSIRQTRFRLTLNLCLYVNEQQPTKDLAPYAEQLLVSAKDLNPLLSAKMPYLAIHMCCVVRDVHSGKMATVMVKDFTDRVVYKALKKLRKSNPDSKHIRVSIGKDHI